MNDRPSASTCFHMSLHVRDLPASTAFYRDLFALEPVEERVDYARFVVLDPPLVLALLPSAGSTGAAPEGPPGETHLSHLGTRELGECLERMLAELSAQDAEVLRLAELEGRPQRELAERWSLSASGAKSRVQRARRRLRERFLECCELERDGRGGVVDWRRRAGCGPGPDCEGDGGQATRGSPGGIPAGLSPSRQDPRVP